VVNDFALKYLRFPRVVERPHGRSPESLQAMQSADAGYAVAGKVATLRLSPDAAEPPCPHFGPCGGCQLQNLQYAAQLAAKQAQVRERFQVVFA